MTEFEIALASAYLAASAQDPVAALVRSVRDIARLRRTLASGSRVDEGAAEHPGMRRLLRAHSPKIEARA